MCPMSSFLVVVRDQGKHAPSLLSHMEELYWAQGFIPKPLEVYCHIPTIPFFVKVVKGFDDQPRPVAPTLRTQVLHI